MRLTSSRRFTYISGHPSATDRGHDRESLPAKDRRSTAVPRNKPRRYARERSPIPVLTGLHLEQLRGCDNAIVISKAAVACAKLFSVKYCDRLVYVCWSLSVCLSVCWHISKTARPNFTKFNQNFLYMLPVAVARSSSDGSVLRYVLSVLRMTSCFQIKERMGKIRDDEYVSSSSPSGGTGVKVCRLRLHHVFVLYFAHKLLNVRQC